MPPNCGSPVLMEVWDMTRVSWEGGRGERGRGRGGRRGGKGRLRENRVGRR